MRKAFPWHIIMGMSLFVPGFVPAGLVWRIDITDTIAINRQAQTWLYHVLTMMDIGIYVKLPWIFPRVLLIFNGAPKNIQGNLACMH